MSFFIRKSIFFKHKDTILNEKNGLKLIFSSKDKMLLVICRNFSKNALTLRWFYKNLFCK